MLAFLPTFLLTFQTNPPNAYCSRLTMWDRVAIEAGSLVAREREVDRSTGRSGDGGR